MQLCMQCWVIDQGGSQSTRYYNTGINLLMTFGTTAFQNVMDQLADNASLTNIDGDADVILQKVIDAVIACGYACHIEKESMPQRICTAYASMCGLVVCNVPATCIAAMSKANKQVDVHDLQHGHVRIGLLGEGLQPPATA